jgi:prevent-host-death family protein
MQVLTIAAAKARLSAVLARVEAGEEVVITRRGIAIARIVSERPAEPATKPPSFDMTELFAFVDNQPMHRGPDAAEFIGDLRAAERF